MRDGLEGTNERLVRLLAVIDDAYVGVRAGVVEALGTMGKDAATAVPHLIKALGDSSRDVRKEAAKALGLVGPPAVEAIPALTRR